MPGACGLGLLLALLLLPMVSASRPGTVFRLNKEVLSYGKRCAVRLSAMCVCERVSLGVHACRIQILNVDVSHLRLTFVANFGIRLLAATNFTLKIFRDPEPLHLLLPTALLADTSVEQGSIGTPLVSISSCFSIFDKAIVFDGRNSTAPAMLAPLQSHIKAVLQSKLCLRISNLVQGLNVHLGTLIGLSPVGPESQVRYSMINTPTITNDYISLDINAVLFLLGRPIVLPVDTTPFVLPQHVGTKGAMATVGLSQDLFDSAIMLLQKAGALNLDVTAQLNSSNNPLNTSVLGQLIPEVARQFPEPMPLVLKVRLGATPTVTFRTNNATMRLQPFVEVLAPTSNSAFQYLFSLNVVNLSLQLSVSKVRLRGTTSVLGNVQLTVASSNLGFIDTDHVQTVMGEVFEKPLLDHLNALLGMGIALPHVVNLQYVTPEIFIQEGYVVVSSGLLYQR
ncbi:BPIFB2 [Cervus elaphus hippelaphus]|uniref:BPIFB2 n=1 Tax=Cervus elaphus hippelaphus TaxID=46360 RepID=A0A212CC45_CEREH|nr:BPIFB2 [Cervus elaphus hippelaphus]